MKKLLFLLSEAWRFMKMAFQKALDLLSFLKKSLSTEVVKDQKWAAGKKELSELELETHRFKIVYRDGRAEFILDGVPLTGVSSIQVNLGAFDRPTAIIELAE